MEMSGNSWASALQTAPMVSDLAAPCGGPTGASTGSAICASSSGGMASSSRSAMAGSARQVGELVLADLELVAVLETGRLDPAAFDLGAVERAEVVQEPRAGAAHEHGVVARHRDVVEEHLGVRRAADRHALAAQRERLPDAPAARPDDQRAGLGRHIADVDGPQLARRLVDDVRGGVRLLATGRLRGAEVRTALGAVVRPLGDDEPAPGAVPRHEALGLLAARGAAGEDVGQPLHVGAGDHVLPALVLLAQPVDELGAEDVDLAV